jgi:DNA-binding SARP family transcriptional activator
MIGVLGPVGYWVDGAFTVPAGSRQQKILATLLLNMNRVVLEDGLVSAIWDEDPPTTARRQIVNGVSMLRRELTYRGGTTIDRTPGGYSLRLPTGHSDVEQFRSLVDRAREAAARRDLAGGSQLFRDAIQLWRGPALAGLETGPLRVAADSLEEARMAVIEELSQLELRRRSPATALALVAEPLHRHPFREQLVALQMLALLGMSQRVAALDAYTRFRTSLVDELGISPTRYLAELHAHILNDTSYADALALSAP